MEENSWPSKYWKFGIGGNLAGRQPKKACSEVIISELEEWKASKELAEDRQA